MDQVKIGKFISDERKAKGYTQKQLSELFGISDKTISKMFFIVLKNANKKDAIMFYKNDMYKVS